MNIYYRLDGDTPVPCRNVREWGAWLATPKLTLIVARDTTPNGTVCTVFFGMDQRTIYLASDGDPGEGDPVLWGSRIFGGERDGEERHYTSAADARNGHAEWLAELS